MEGTFFQEKIQIRSMTEADVPAVAELEKEIFPLPWSENALQNTLTDPNAVFLVADYSEAESVIAYAGMYTAADEGEITNVAASPSFRKRGAAYLLLTELVRIAREKSLSQLVLEVRLSNEAAIGLYEKTGFQIAGTRKGFYQFPPEDAYIMIMRL